MTDPAPAALHLLVVDDEEQILELLDLTLSLQGFRVTTAPSGPAALERLSGATFDVLVLDVLMTPWDGFETVERMARHLGSALPPVVFLSGLAHPTPPPTLNPRLLDHYLLKPFRPSQLVEAIRRAHAAGPLGRTTEF
ncbi:response regulator [Deinococcus sp. HMF7620]|uniref:Response regulator n=1 Tax=Deinococcus arboris TaxID=2682977 RepID=A0A7C9MAW7_9DEIO|nr:response regulator [Deinococcus arboris]MVN88683.1 response regulator [Deinococcus arboris]